MRAYLRGDKIPPSFHETNGNLTTVLLANGHRLLCQGLQEILSEDGSTKTVGEAQDAEETVVLSTRDA